MKRWMTDTKPISISILIAMGAILSVVGATTGAVAMPLLSEVYYDAPGSDDGLVFVELYGSPGLLLEGYSIEGVNGSNGDVGPTIQLEGMIGVDGLFVVADRRADGTTGVAGADWLAPFDFQNGPDSVRLRRGEMILDALGYGVFDPDEVFAGEGSPATEGPAGTSLARRFANLDTGNNAADFVILETPTPGQAVLSPVPEPGTACLMGLGLIGLSQFGAQFGSQCRSRSRSRSGSERGKTKGAISF